MKKLTDKEITYFLNDKSGKDIPEYLKKLNCKIVCSTENQTREEWLTYRQKGIGGSDIASMLGINPFHSPLALYWDKVSNIEIDEEENVPAEVGIALEPLMKKKLLNWIWNNKKDRKVRIDDCKYILQHPENPLALANVDGIIEWEDGELCVAEYKTTNERNYKLWEGDNIPDYYYLQTQWYLYTTGLEICYLAFLIGNRKFDVKIIERNDAVIEQLVNQTKDFWEDFIIPRIPPSPDGSISSGQTIKRMYPEEEAGKIIDITNMENQRKMERLEIIKGQAKELKKEGDFIKQEFQVQMGDAEQAICSEKMINWKMQERKEHIVKASKSRVMRIGKYKGNGGK